MLAASAQAPRGTAPSRADAAQTASRPRSPAASLRGRPRVALGIACSLEGMTAPGSAGASAPVSRPCRGAGPQAESPPAQRGTKPLRRGGLCPTPHGGTHQALGCGTRAHTATGITQLCKHLCAHTHAQGHTRPALRKPVRLRTWRAGSPSVGRPWLAGRAGEASSAALGALGPGLSRQPGSQAQEGGQERPEGRACGLRPQGMA